MIPVATSKTWHNLYVNNSLEWSKHWNGTHPLGTQTLVSTSCAEAESGWKSIIEQSDVTNVPTNINRCGDLTACCNLILLQDCPSSSSRRSHFLQKEPSPVLRRHALRPLRVWALLPRPPLRCVFLFWNVPAALKLLEIGQEKGEESQTGWWGFESRGPLLLLSALGRCCDSAHGWNENTPVTDLMPVSQFASSCAAAFFWGGGWKSVFRTCSFINVLHREEVVVESSSSLVFKCPCGEFG